MFPLALGIGEGSEFSQPLGVVVSGLSLVIAITLLSPILIEALRSREVLRSAWGEEKN